jgi:hypothetical protein
VALFGQTNGGIPADETAAANNENFQGSVSLLSLGPRYSRFSAPGQVLKRFQEPSNDCA